MNPIKRKLAEFLTDMSIEAMETLDPESPYAEALLKVHRDGLLEENIRRICDEVTTWEAGKILSKSAKLMLVGPEGGQREQEEIRAMARGIIGRVEKKGGGLNLPPECMDLILEL